MSDDKGQLQVIEAITVALFIFVAIALSAIFRLPTSPGTFQDAELERIAADQLKILANTVPSSAADCNETPCPFAQGSELERLLSLALGYVGKTVGAGEAADRSLLADVLGQAMGDGIRYVAYYSNGVNATKITPLAIEPPRLNVVVAHHFISPNWTVWSASLEDSVLLRIGETTNFVGATEIRDPLNRSATEFGAAWKDLYGSQVPENASLGTHRVCYGAVCQFATVTPPGIFGAGSQILKQDRDNSSRIKTLGDFYAYAKYNDTDASGSMQFTEPVYIDLVNAGSNVVDVGDLRLSPVSNCIGSTTCKAGTFVETGASDIGRALSAIDSDIVNVRGGDKNGNGLLDAGEAIYLGNNGTTLDVGERRLSRFGTHPFGSNYASGDLDAGASLTLTFSGVRIVWADADDDGLVDPKEAVYLDLEGSGQSIGLDEKDFHLTPIGNPTIRSFYDIRLVVWFGV
jgi:hypothetical protein